MVNIKRGFYLFLLIFPLYCEDGERGSHYTWLWCPLRVAHVVPCLHTLLQCKPRVAVVFTHSYSQGITLPTAVLHVISMQCLPSSSPPTPLPPIVVMLLHKMPVVLWSADSRTARIDYSECMQAGTAEDWTREACTDKACTFASQPCLSPSFILYSLRVYSPLFLGILIIFQDLGDQE